MKKVIETVAISKRDHVRITSFTEVCRYLHSFMCSADYIILYLLAIPQLYFDRGLQKTHEEMSEMDVGSCIHRLGRNCMDMFSNPIERTVYVVDAGRSSAFATAPKLFSEFLGFGNISADKKCVCVHSVYVHNNSASDAKKIALNDHDCSSKGNDLCIKHCLKAASWIVKEEKKRLKLNKIDASKKRRKLFNEGWFASHPDPRVQAKTSLKRKL